jgi:hypothetical protein
MLISLPSGVILLDSWFIQMRRGTADFIAIWSLLDSWFIQTRRVDNGVCNNIVQWLRVITRIGQVVMNLKVNKGIHTWIGTDLSWHQTNVQTEGYP